MFEHLAEYRAILVSGPQRSGTRIAAKMIAADTGHRYIDEREFRTYSRQAFCYIVDTFNEIVVHCPSMSHVLHRVSEADTLAVFMIRDLADIRASEVRVNWRIGVYQELYNYGFRDREGRPNELAAIRYRRHGGEIAPLKYARWWAVQRERCQNWLELKYESLAGHPLWVDKEDRADFLGEQTSGP